MRVAAQQKPAHSQTKRGKRGEPRSYLNDNLRLIRVGASLHMNVSQLCWPIRILVNFSL